jgi:hypothetical protein
MIMTATLKATAAIAMRMIKEENDLDLLKAILAYDKEFGIQCSRR